MNSWEEDSKKWSKILKEQLKTEKPFNRSIFLKWRREMLEKVSFVLSDIGLLASQSKLAQQIASLQKTHKHTMENKMSI